MTTLATTFVRKRSLQVGARIRTILLAGLVPWLVVACGNRNIDLVKAQMVPGDNYTYGQILDNNKNCEDKSWKAFRDEKQRDMVRFHCNVVIPDSMLQKALEDVEARIQGGRAELLKVYTRRLEIIQSNLSTINERCAARRPGFPVRRAELTEKQIYLQTAPLDRSPGRPWELSSDRERALENVQGSIKLLDADIAECATEPERLNRQLARMEEVRPDFMAALETYAKERRKQTEAYYRQKRPTSVDLLFSVQGDDVRLAVFTLDVNGENLGMWGQYLIASLLASDDSRLPMRLMEKIERERDQYVQTPFPYLCKGEYCDRGESAQKDSASKKPEAVQNSGS
ncbi:MAG: hypothetical protein E6Q94_05825 [Burkholderiaceae bacterium]|nr:MAG: hypothetical protein E6Q94_05825 [Burkholderiaceae bacterium]